MAAKSSLRRDGAADALQTPYFLARAKIEDVITRHIDLTFIARDLGFPDGTAIHEAVKPILARHIAGIALQANKSVTDAIKEFGL